MATTTTIYTLRLRPFFFPSSSTFPSTPMHLLRGQYSSISTSSTSISHKFLRTISISRRPAAARATAAAAGGVLLASATATGVVSPYTAVTNMIQAQTHRCDAVAAAGTGARRPIHTTRGGGSGSIINKRTAKQLSTGSVLGLGAGVAISIFSKPLTILLGLFIATTQLFQLATGARIPLLDYAEAKLARTVRQKAANAGDALDAAAWKENVVFRLSFGLACLLAGGFIDM